MLRPETGWKRLLLIWLILMPYLKLAETLWFN